jgi:rRNA biogenesis protein RRP5
MPGKKREREDVEPAKKPKKTKFADDDTKTLKPAPEELDFPRGGGSTFTPLEYKKIRTEAFKEADAEVVFEVSMETHLLLGVHAVTLGCQDSQAGKKTKTKQKADQRKGKSPTKRNGVKEDKKKSENIRVEHLNYKVRP